jgi:steroid delta-isomerase-like uncharacterized protein
MTRIFKIIFSLLLLGIIFLNCTNPNPATTFKPLIEKYVEFWNTGDFAEIEKILHPDFELRMTPKFEAEKGIEAFKESISKWREAYPDFNIELHEIVYDKDSAAARWTITATNTGTGLHPPTGKHVEVMGISIVHFVDNKIKDEWIASNNLYWLQQLGFKLVPASEDE